MTFNGYTISDMERAYIAGFFDGEGWIGARNRGIYYTLEIEATNKDKEPIQFIADALGGNIRERPPSRGRCLHYRWGSTGRPAAQVLEKLLPYLICKKERAILGIELVYATDKRRYEIVNKIKDLNMMHGKGPRKGGAL